MRPLVRILVALSLPVIIPAIITGVVWALPGDPASIICPPEICFEASQSLAARWHLDQGPVHFYTHWLGLAFVGDLGKSWRVEMGRSVTEMMISYGPKTILLIAIGIVPVLLGSVGAAFGLIPKKLDGLFQAVGLAPSVILGLLAAAYIQITYGAASFDEWPTMVRILLGGLVLGLSDGMLASAVIGTRSVLDEELKQRYVQIATLRGESVLSNMLPNILPALIGQFRGRVLGLLSGAVVVEVVLGIDGVGSLLWMGTTMQDFGVVLAATWVIAVFSSCLMVGQALVEVGIALHIRRAPVVPL